MTRDQTTSYALGSVTTTGGVATSNYTVIDWLTFQVTHMMDVWTLSDWLSAFAVVAGLLGVLVRIVTDVLQARRSRERHRMEMELLRLKIDEHDVARGGD